MTRHQTVQPKQTNRMPNTTHSSQTPKVGPGKVTPIPVPPRQPGINDAINSPAPGQGNLGPAAA